jgi:hypothetical protein
MNNTDSFTNHDRRRYYGLRIGDIVSCETKHMFRAEVTGWGGDNNRVQIRVLEWKKGDNFDIIPHETDTLAEYCTIITKVENRELRERIASVLEARYGPDDKNEKLLEQLEYAFEDTHRKHIQMGIDEGRANEYSRARADVEDEIKARYEEQYGWFEEEVKAEVIQLHSEIKEQFPHNDNVKKMDRQASLITDVLTTVFQRLTATTKGAKQPRILPPETHGVASLYHTRLKEIIGIMLALSQNGAWYKDKIELPENIDGLSAARSLEEALHSTEQYRAQKPYTLEEQAVMFYIGLAHDSFAVLKASHPNELTDWVQAIHQLQMLISMRILRRNWPKAFYSLPGFNEEDNANSRKN